MVRDCCQQRGAEDTIPRKPAMGRGLTLLNGWNWKQGPYMNRIVRTASLALVSAFIGCLSACSSYSPMYKAADKNDAASINEQVAKGASPNTPEHNGRVPLHAAAAKGNLAAAQALLAAGADPNKQDDRGDTPLMTAAAHGFGGIVQAMLDKHPPLDVQNKGGKTALYFAVENGHGDIANMLIKAGAKTDIKDNEGRSPTDLAQAKGISLTGNP
jgi:ankyrin repeat protein